MSPRYKKAAADAGITVEIVDFTDYAQPNPALAEGELDLGGDPTRKSWNWANSVPRAHPTIWPPWAPSGRP